jgi:hypothetical protein
MDLFVTLLVILSFATLATAHVWIVVGLVTRQPRWRAPIALVVPPLAPYWGFRENMRARAVVWTAALAVYALTLAVGYVVRR